MIKYDRIVQEECTIKLSIQKIKEPVQNIVIKEPVLKIAIKAPVIDPATVKVEVMEELDNDLSSYEVLVMGIIFIYKNIHVGEKTSR